MYSKLIDSLESSIISILLTLVLRNLNDESIRLHKRAACTHCASFIAGDFEK